MKETIGFVNEFRAGTQLAPVFGKATTEMVAGFYAHTYVMLAVYQDHIELACIHTEVAWRGNGFARRMLGFLTMLAVKNHVNIWVRRLAPFDNSPLDAVVLARWFFRRGLRVVGMGNIRQQVQGIQS